MKRKSDYARPYLRAAVQKNHLLLALDVLFVILGSILSASLAILLQLVIDTANGVGQFTVVQLLYITLAMAGGIVLCFLGRREFYSRFLRRANRQYRQAIFDDLTKKNIAAFSSERTGDYISVLTSDAAKVDTKYFQKISDLIEESLCAVFGFILMILYSWQLSLVALGLTCLPVLVSVFFSGTLTRQEKQVSEENAKFVSSIKDLLSGFSVIKSFQAEKRVCRLYGDKNGAVEQLRYRSQRTTWLIRCLSQVAGVAMQLGVFLVGAQLATQGQITSGVIIAFLQLTGFVIQPLQALPEEVSAFRAARALVSRAGKLLGEHTARETGAQVQTLGDGIVCQDLHFGYEAGQEVLKGIDVCFAPGKSYALVGASGSGKSTLLNLLLGGYDGYTGSITLADHALREVGEDSLYRLISIIQQNVFIFDATIAENITMFREFPEESVRDAIRRAGLEELVREKGMDYSCGENGCNLSGGERQRISIARCLLKNTQVLLMDEATAALDTQTSASITGAILDVRGLTRILVTHKLDAPTLRRFDEILVLRDGKITERGTFDTLLESDGYFSALYRVTAD